VGVPRLTPGGQRPARRPLPLRGLTPCLGAGAGLAWLLALPAPGSARPDDPRPEDLPPFYGEGDLVERHDSPGGGFRVHFTREGPNAVPPTDADGMGLPDVVEEAAEVLDAALAHYVDELGFLPPPTDGMASNDGGSEAFDVYLLEAPLGANGAFRREGCSPDDGCWGYAILAADLTERGYPSARVGLEVVGSHELFHAVQAAYGGELAVVPSEGSATWATESFSGGLDDFERSIVGYLERTERSLDQEPTGPIDRFSYGSALFFRFLEERFDPALVREVVVEATLFGDAWLPAVADLLDAEATPFAETFTTFSVWNLGTGSRRLLDDEGYVAARRYPAVAPREILMPFEDDDVRVFRASTRYYRAPLGTGVGDVLVGVFGEAADLADLMVLAAAEDRDGGLALVETDAADAAPLRLPVATETQAVHVALINTAPAGGSRRPGVCVAREDDAGPRGCPPNDPPPPPSDGGKPPPPTADADPPTRGREGAHGCEVARVRGGGGAGIPFAALLALLLIRRRRDVPYTDNARLIEPTGLGLPQPSVALDPRQAGVGS